MLVCIQQILYGRYCENGAFLMCSEAFGAVENAELYILKVNN